MEDLKKIQEFFSKPLEENTYVEAFKLEKALKGMGYDVKVKYLDDFGKDVFEIYFNNPADADESIFYDAKKLGYDNVRVFANPNEATKEEETEFHTKLDKLVHDTFGKRKGEMEEYNTGIYYNPTKERNAPKAKEASKSGIEKVKDMLKKIMKEDMSLDDQAKAYFLAKVKKGEIDTLPDNPKAAFLAQMMKNQMGEALSDYEEKDADYDKLYSDYLYKMVKEVATEKGYSKFLVSKDNPKGETSGLDTKTMNKILMNVIKDLDETVKLGKNLNEELCPKGKAYIKKRQAAGEKSSAYLSGRAVKVCKGQMKG